MRRSTLKKLFVAVLAAGTLTTPAFAKSVDRVDRFDSPTSSLSGVYAAPSQDLRGEHARDAARLAGQPSADKVKPRVYWTYDYEAAAPHPAGPVPSSPRRTVPAAPDDGTPWAAIAVALAGIAVFAGGMYVTTRAPHTKTA